MEGMPFLFIRGFVLFLYYLIHYGLSVLKQHLADVDAFLRSRKEGAVEAVIRYFDQLTGIGTGVLQDACRILPCRIVFIYFALGISIALLHDVLNQRIGVNLKVGVVLLAVKRVGEGICGVVWIQTIGCLP